MSLTKRLISKISCVKVSFPHLVTFKIQYEKGRLKLQILRKPKFVNQTDLHLCRDNANIVLHETSHMWSTVEDF